MSEFCGTVIVCGCFLLAVACISECAKDGYYGVRKACVEKTGDPECGPVKP